MKLGYRTATVISALPPRPSFQHAFTNRLTAVR